MKNVFKVFDERIRTSQNGRTWLGVKIALSSDAGVYIVKHGCGLMDEIACFEEIGFSRDQIEKMCFENGMKALQLCTKAPVQVSILPLPMPIF